MERVTFLVERSGERIPCLLNPEHLEVRRAAGIARRRSAGGAIIGNPRTDDPLVATGGGTTDYEFRLLFDVDLLAGLAATAPAELPLAPAIGAEGDLFAALNEPGLEGPEPAGESGLPEPEGEGDIPGPEGTTEAAPAIASAAAPAQPSLDVRT